MELNLDLADFRYSHSEAGLLSQISYFNGAWSFLGNLGSEKLAQLQAVAMVESIGSSMRLDGISFSDAQAKELLEISENRQYSNKYEKEVLRYASALSVIHSSWRDSSLSEHLIARLHESLFELGTEDRQGNEIYEAEKVSPLKRLVNWYNEESERRVYHQLLLISVFITAFLAIQPFQDGNGRLSRVLTTLLLLRSGFSYVPYSSIESVMEKSKAAYYQNLRQSQMTMEEEHPNWRPFFDYFLSCLQIQMKVLESKVSQEHLLAGVPELSRSILKLLENGAPVGIAELEKALKVPRSTIRFHLKRLLKDKRIISFGKASAVKYQIKKASDLNFK